MIVKVDPDKCISCGMCVTLCPTGFRMNDDYKSEPIEGGGFDCAKNAAENCPVDAISVE